MVRMSAVWERTQAVLRGRGGMLAGIALLTLVAPDWLQAAWVASVPAGPANAGGAAVIGLAGAVLALVGMLAIIATASDPKIGRDEAFALGLRRFLPALGIAFLFGFVVLVVMLPALVLLGRAGLTMSAQAITATSMTSIDPATAGGALLYLVLLLPVLLVVGARLSVLWPVVLFERPSLRAPLRAWALTRGLTARLVGVLILWSIVLIVAVAALVGAGGVIFALVFGPGTPALAVAMALVTALVTIAATVVQSAFSAQLYVALAGPPRGGPA